jgi:hypothetical protein
MLNLCDLLFTSIQTRIDRIKQVDWLIYIEKVEKEWSFKNPLKDKEKKDLETAVVQFFTLCLTSKNNSVYMPSLVVDKVWHEFILDTKSYRKFCDKVFSKYLDHNPSGKSTIEAENRLKIATFKKTFEITKNIQYPTLPLLFAIDEQLKVRGGFKYDPIEFQLMYPIQHTN